MQYTVNDAIIQYETSNKTVRGQNITLIQQAVDLTKEQPWHAEGYTLATLFNPDLYKSFVTETDSLLRKLIKKAGLNPDAIPSLELYHQLIPDQATHLRVIENTKLLSVEKFPVPHTLLESRISELLHERLIIHNPFDNQKVFHFRIIRPGSRDNNPLHRDVWLEDYDNCINLYIPIAGSNELSSLVLAPGSHLWAEDRLERTVEGAIIGNAKFNVPAVTKITGDYEFIRPNPKENEVLIFSPYLVHGGALNLNEDKTRISLEIRLWKKP